MRIVTLEEHIRFPKLVEQIPAKLLPRQTTLADPGFQLIAEQLEDISIGRLSSMDEAGISVQVLSVSGAGADLLSAENGPVFARQYNDSLAKEIAPYPDRFAAFAHLPMTDPKAAAIEMERTLKNHHFRGALINGLTNNEFLDNLKYSPVFKQAEQLDVPIYLHPGLPPESVADAYYNGLPNLSGMKLSMAGWGWHSETAIHVLRLILSGTLDRHPGLKLIIGHMGEMLPMMMARCDHMFKLGESGNNQRSISETLRDQVYITTSGVFTLPPLQAALDTFGIDHILFSVDYPYCTNLEGRQFLDSIQLPSDQIEQIAHGNADKLLKLRS